MKNAENRSTGVACLLMTGQDCLTRCPSFSTADITTTITGVSLEALKQTFEKSTPEQKQGIIDDAVENNLNGDIDLCANPVPVVFDTRQSNKQELFNRKKHRRYKRR